MRRGSPPKEGSVLGEHRRPVDFQRRLLGSGDDLKSVQVDLGAAGGASLAAALEAACAGGATYAGWEAAARGAWLERVKFAASPGQVLQCLLLLETRVAQDWVNQWWWLTPRPNAALRVRARWASVFRAVRIPRRCCEV